MPGIEVNRLLRLPMLVLKMLLLLRRPSVVLGLLVLLRLLVVLGLLVLRRTRLVFGCPWWGLGHCWPCTRQTGAVRVLEDLWLL